MNKNDEKKCIIAGCNSKAKTLCYLGGIELNYCAKHFPLGLRVVDFFIDTILESKVSKIVEPIRTEVFADGDVYLCPDCQTRLGSQLQEAVVELDEVNRLKYKYDDIRANAVETLELLNNPASGSQFDALLSI